MGVCVYIAFICIHHELFICMTRPIPETSPHMGVMHDTSEFHNGDAN